MLSRTFLFFLFTLFLPLPAFSATSLPIPFTSQAPLFDWRQPWQDACEETVIVMVDNFYKKTLLSDPKVARNQILNIFTIKESVSGKSLDENADQIVSLINNSLSWEARVVESPTIEDIKAEIDAGRPIILPTSGVELRNPHFRSWPNYHTIIISGYDDETQDFITQEPGTRFGLDFRYSYDRILDAMHDFVSGGKTPTGRKVAIFTSPILNHSAHLDADQDGLTKEQELLAQTFPWKKDTDGDSFPDGEEVANGYLPILAEKTLPAGTLIKAPNNPKVYKLEKGLKRHIVNEEVFNRLGWKSDQIRLVSKMYVNSLEEGKTIE